VRTSSQTSQDLVACPPQAEISPDLPKGGLTTIARAIHEAITIDLTQLADNLPLSEDREWCTLWPGKHHAFLIGLTKILQPRLAIDVGTYHGASALAMSDWSERILTYDIVSLTDIGNACANLTKDHFNIVQLVGDLVIPEFFESQRLVFGEVDLVLIHGPKDGLFEYQVVPTVIDAVKPGSIPIPDDIRSRTCEISG
jgi:predicted O-methyltransferase YrrM